MLNRSDQSGNVRERVALKSRDLIYLACSRDFARALGFDSPEQLIGKTDIQLFPLDRARHEIQLDTRTLETAKPEITMLMLDSGQQLIVVRVPVMSPRGTVTGIDIRLLGSTDTTKSQSGSGSNNFQSMAESGLQGSLVIRNEVALYANENAAALFGLESADDITARTSIVSLFPKEEWPRIKRNLLLRASERNNGLPVRYTCLSWELPVSVISATNTTPKHQPISSGNSMSI